MTPVHPVVRNTDATVVQIIAAAMISQRVSVAIFQLSTLRFLTLLARAPNPRRQSAKNTEVEARTGASVVPDPRRFLFAMSLPIEFLAFAHLT